jgi:hypothetical protein
MKNQWIDRWFVSILAIFSVGAIAPFASAATFTFQNIPSPDGTTDTSGDRFAGDFGLEVSEIDGEILFEVANLVSHDFPFVQSVHLSDRQGLLTSLDWNASSVGTVFFQPTTNSLPQAERIPHFTQTAAARYASSMGGIHPRERLGFTAMGSFTAVIAALTDGSLTIGLAVADFPDGQSDSFVTALTAPGIDPDVDPEDDPDDDLTDDPSEAVPEPLTILGSTLALLGGVYLRDHHKRQP